MKWSAESAEDVNYHRLANPTFNYLQVDTDPDYLLERDTSLNCRKCSQLGYQQQGKKKRIDVYKHVIKGVAQRKTFLTR